MIRPATETHRGSTPLLAIGPGGLYVDRWYARRHEMVQEPSPTPGVPLLKPTPTLPQRALPTDPNIEPWSWSRVLIGMAMGMLIGLVLMASVYGTVSVIHALIDAAFQATGLGRYQ